MKSLIMLLCIVMGGGYAQAENAKNKNPWQAASFGYLQGLGDENFHLTMLRQDNQKSYQLYVRLPQPLEDNTTYPVVYLLDGGITFPMLSAHYHLLNALQELPKVILVGISYGTGDWRKGNNRGADFTAPSAEREHWGGAGDFLTFLQQQVFPTVEKHFPADPDKRILFGNSLGGQFGLYTALHGQQAFYGIIASNPAIHTNTAFYLQPGASARKKTRLFIGSAENDAAVFKQPFTTWLEHWSSQPAKPFELMVKTLPEHSHVSSIPDAFYHGMKWLLPSPQGAGGQ